MNSEDRPPSRIVAIIDRLRSIADAIGITGIAFQVGNSAQGKGPQLVMTTRNGLLSWTTPSTGEEEVENEQGGIRPGAGARDLRPGRAPDKSKDYEGDRRLSFDGSVAVIGSEAHDCMSLSATSLAAVSRCYEHDGSGAGRAVAGALGSRP